MLKPGEIPIKLTAGVKSKVRAFLEPYLNYAPNVGSWNIYNFTPYEFGSKTDFTGRFGLESDIYFTHYYNKKEDKFYTNKNYGRN